MVEAIEQKGVWRMSEVALVGKPDGAMAFIKELGMEVGTFVEPHKNALNYHVPLHFRGPYRPEQLANYSPENDYRTDDLGFALCCGITKAGSLCNRKAVNRFQCCDLHGGSIHPLDQILKEQVEGPESASLSRFQQFKAGYITVDDLDDEELAQCGFRSEKNGQIYKPRQVPRELANAFQRAIFERAQEELRGLTIEAARTVGEIMKNKNVEPDIRLKSALSLLERTLGKPSTNVVVTQDKPFEHVFTDIEVGSRDQSRRNRGIIIDSEGEPIDQAGSGQSSDIGSDPFGIGAPEPGQVAAIGYAPEPGIDNGPNTIGENEGQSDAPTVRDALSVRNEAVLAQFVERKPFEYDLTDHREDVKKATKKRYASRALGVDLSGPFIPFLVDVRRSKSGTFVRYIDPETKNVGVPKNSAGQKRKRFTLDDF